MSTAFAENLHFTYLWHLEQPIYWPDQEVSGADRYERYEREPDAPPLAERAEAAVTEKAEA